MGSTLLFIKEGYKRPPTLVGIIREAKFPFSFVVELLKTTTLYGCPAPPSQSSLQASFMAPRCIVTGKEVRESRRVAFLNARDHTQGKEVMASRRAKAITAGGHTVMWADFEAAMAEWEMDLEVAKAAHKEQKRQKAIKKRESRRCKKKEVACRGEETLAEIEARWAAAYKAGKENTGVWPACPDGSM